MSVVVGGVEFDRSTVARDRVAAVTVLDQRIRQVMVGGRVVRRELDRAPSSRDRLLDAMQPSEDPGQAHLKARVVGTECHRAFEVR